MGTLSYYFSVFRQSTAYVFSRLSVPPGLLLFFWLEKTLAVLRPVALLFFLPYFLLRLDHLRLNPLLAAYSLLVFLFLMFIVPLLRKNVYVCILNGVFEWYSFRRVFSWRDLWRLTKNLKPLNKEVEKGVSGVRKMRGFYYKLLWFCLRAGKGADEFNRAVANNVFSANYTELLNRRFSGLSMVYRFCALSLLLLSMAWLFPVQPAQRQFGGLMPGLMAFDLTVSSLAFFSVITSMLLALFNLFCFLPMDQALITHCFFCSNQDEAAVHNILVDVREKEREGKLLVNGVAVDDFRIEFIFLISLLIFSVIISLLWPFFAVVFVFALYFLLPSLYQKIGRSRLFLAFHVVGNAKKVPGTGRLLLFLLSSLLWIQFAAGGLFLLNQLPVAMLFYGYIPEQIWSRSLLIRSFLFLLPLIITIFFYRQVEKGFFSQKKRMLEALNLIIWQNVFLLFSIVFFSPVFEAGVAGFAAVSLIILNKLKRSF
jgi:hypothetical protein